MTEWPHQDGEILQENDTTGGWSMTSHSPGPWRVVVGFTLLPIIRDAAHLNVAQVALHVGGETEMAANARLIAAATTLLAACEQALRRTVGGVRACLFCGVPTREMDHEPGCWVPDMLAAVARAKGEEEAS